MKKYISVTVLAVFLSPYSSIFGDTLTLKTGLWSTPYKFDMETRMREDDLLDGTTMDSTRLDLKYNDVGKNNVPVIMEYSRKLTDLTLLGSVRFHHTGAGHSYYALDYDENVTYGKLVGGYAADWEADAGGMYTLKKWKLNLILRGGVFHHSLNFNYAELTHGKDTLMIADESNFRSSSYHGYLRGAFEYEVHKNTFIVGEVQSAVTGANGFLSYDLNRMGKFNNKHYYETNSIHSQYRYQVNRYYAGIRYGITERIRIELGYMHETGVSEYPGYENLPLLMTYDQKSGYAPTEFTIEISKNEWLYDYLTYMNKQPTLKSGVYALASMDFNL